MALTKVSGSILKDPLNLGGQVSIGGTLTYEDVTNVDSIGIITARSGINVSGGQIDVGSNIKLGNAGVITATSYRGDGSQLTGISAGVSLANGVNNRVVTATGAAALNGESTLTYDGNGLLNITGTGAAGVFVITPSNTDGGIYFNDGSNSGAVTYLHTNNTLNLRVGGNNKVTIDNSGNLNLNFDNANLQIGAGQDLKLYHDGSNSYIDNATNILWIRNQTTGSSIYMRSDELLFQTYTDSPNENYIVATRGADDAVLFVNKTNNNDWAAKFDISAGSATDYGLQIKTPGAADNCFNIRDTSSNNVVRMQGNGHIHTGHHWPTSTNGGHNLGSNSNKWGRVFSANTPAVLISVDLAANSNHSAYGVQVVYHYGSGQFQVVFAQNMPNDNYVTTASAVGSINGDGMVVAGIGGSTDYRTIGSLRMRVSYCTNNSGNDVTNVNLAFFANN